VVVHVHVVGCLRLFENPVSYNVQNASGQWRTVELAISRALARLAAPGEEKTDHIHEHVDVDVVVHVHVVGCLRLFENPVSYNV
jgi:hypothetical protein